MRIRFAVRVAGIMVVAAAILVGKGRRADARQRTVVAVAARARRIRQGTPTTSPPRRSSRRCGSPKTGQTYELGRVYEAEMPQYGYRPYFLTDHSCRPSR